MLFHAIARAKEAELVDDVLVASPHVLPDLPVGIREFVFNGDESDVLGRYHACLEANPAAYIVRLTSDCPLLDPGMIDTIVAWTLSSKADYGSNLLPATFPDGFDVEVISSKLLQWLHENATDPADREHVTWRLRRDPKLQSELKIFNLSGLLDYSDIKLSVDTKEDLERVREWESSNA